MPSSSGLQFSLSESLLPHEAKVLAMVVVGFWARAYSSATARGWTLLWRWLEPSAVRPPDGLLSFVLLVTPAWAPALPMGARRLALLLAICSRELVALVERTRLMAAMAEPLLSCLACRISGSSRFSELAVAQSSQAWTLLDRLRRREAGRLMLLQR